MKSPCCPALITCAITALPISKSLLISSSLWYLLQGPASRLKRLTPRVVPNCTHTRAQSRFAPHCTWFWSLMEKMINSGDVCANSKPALVASPPKESTTMPAWYRHTALPIMFICCHVCPSVIDAWVTSLAG